MWDATDEAWERFEAGYMDALTGEDCAYDSFDYVEGYDQALDDLDSFDWSPAGVN